MRSVSNRSSGNSSNAFELAQRRRELSRYHEHLQLQIDELRTLLVAAFERIEQLEDCHPPDLAG